MRQTNKSSISAVESWTAQQPITKIPVALSIVVPAYNEEGRLPPTLIHLIQYCEAALLSYEIIVVDDGSRDHTSDVVRKFERVRQQVRLIQLPRNHGKGHAVRLGVLNSRGEQVLFADADGATPIEELVRLSAALEQGADLAIGSRAVCSRDTKVRAAMYRKIIGRVFNYCVNLVLLEGIADTQCGFKLFTRRAALFLFKRQRSNRFSFDAELLFIAQKVGLSIAEVPVNWTNIEGSKVNLIVDSLSMLRDLFKFRMRHRNLRREDFAWRESALPPYAGAL